MSDPTPRPTPFIYEDTVYVSDEQAGAPIPWLDVEQWYRLGGRLAP